MISRSVFPLAPLSYLADVRPSGVDKHSHPDEVPVRLCNYTDIYYREHITNDIGFMEASATRAEMERFILAPGDVVMTKDSETADDIGIPALVTEELDNVLLGYHNTLVRPSTRLEPRFLFWFLSSPVAAAYWETKARGVTRVGLRTEDVAALPVPVPPFDTQRRIADMLEAETARIDTLIAKNERVLELLDKRETSLITRAVMGGSGLGSDAVSFPMVALRYRTRGIQAGVDFASSDLSMDAADGLVRYVRTTDIASISSLTDAAVYAPVKEVPDSAMARDGDLLVTRAGSLGTAYVHRGAPVAVAGYLVRVQFDGLSDSDFYGYWCRSRPFLDALEVGATQTTIQNFSASKYASMPTPAPQLETQRRVVSLLDADMSKMNALRSAVDRQQELLRLRRQALITAAVTGQIEA